MQVRYDHELLWAHYANSHHGFCIEYNFDELLNVYTNEHLYPFPIKYSTKLPEVRLTDITNMNALDMVNKLVGYKSNEWKYEEEIRIVFDKPKLRNYSPNAITGIYFGLRMPQEQRDTIMKRLTGRKIKFYEIIQKSKSYKFERKEVKNKYKGEFNYLKEIPAKYTRNGNVRFSVIKLDYNWSSKKGSVEISIEKTVIRDALSWLVGYIKENLFYEADRVFINLRLKSDFNKSVFWAVCRYELGDLFVSINE